MIKQIAKRSLALLSNSARYEIFYQFARMLGIRGFMVDGESGPFVGAVADRAIMRTYLLDRKWSPDLTLLISNALTGGGTFVDVGANIGLIALSVSKIPGVKVIALEPDEENYQFLVANVSLHKADHISAIQAAAWSESAELRFGRNSYNSGDHRIDQQGEKIVRAITLDSLEIGGGRLVIKIDTQGAEPAVLAGAQMLLARADLVICEFWPWGMHRMGQSPEQAIAALTAGDICGCVAQHGSFGDWMDATSLKNLLQAQMKHNGEYESIDVAIRPREQ